MSEHSLIVPGDKIPLSTDQKRALEDVLVPLIGAMENQHADLTKKLDLWRKLYDATPRQDQRKIGRAHV